MLPSENKVLFIGVDSFLVLDFDLDILDFVWWFKIEANGLSIQSFDKDIIVITIYARQTQMESGLPLNVVIGDSSIVLEFLTREDKSLLIGWDSFLDLYLCLDVLDSV